MAIFGFGKDKKEDPKASNDARAKDPKASEDARVDDPKESKDSSREDPKASRDARAGKDPKKTSEKAEEKKTEEKRSVRSGIKVDEFQPEKILLRHRITEKAAILADDHNAYTFEVHPDATKNEIKKAVESIYEVKPEKVRIIPIPGKKIVTRGVPGYKSGGKKAVVYLKEGDKIEFV